MAEYKIGDTVYIKATVVDVPKVFPGGTKTKLYGLALFNSNDSTDDERRIWVRPDEIVTQEELK